MRRFFISNSFAEKIAVFEVYRSRTGDFWMCLIFFPFYQTSTAIRTFAFLPIIGYNIEKRSEELPMKHNYSVVRKLTLDHYEIRVLVDALNAKRLKQKASGTDTAETSNLILYLLDMLDS